MHAPPRRPAARTDLLAAGCLVAAGVLTRFQADRLLAGRVAGFVIDPYVIQEPVGRGSVGRVYKAIHRTMNRPVAIKVLAADRTRTPAAREAFRREARAAARLVHPNIVTTYDANEVGGRSFLVLEFVAGPTLAALVAGRGPLPVAEACELVRQVAVGLQHAHDLGITHRDIKPTNLLVAPASSSLPGGVVKIADFGIARLAPPSVSSTDITPAPGPVGSADYLAPECAAGPHSGDHRADLYALGCVFYFLLTGRPPFAGGAAEVKARRHQTEAPVAVDQVRADVPPAVVAVVGRLLAKDPNARFQTAASLAARLDHWAAAAVVSDDGGGVDFDLPAVRPGVYTSPSGYLTGMVSAAFPLAEEAAPETSPWTHLTTATVETRGPVEEPTAPPTRRLAAALGRVVRALAG